MARAQDCAATLFIHHPIAIIIQPVADLIHGLTGLNPACCPQPIVLTNRDALPCTLANAHATGVVEVEPLVDLPIAIVIHPIPAQLFARLARGRRAPHTVLQSTADEFAVPGAGAYADRARIVDAGEILVHLSVTIVVQPVACLGFGYAERPRGTKPHAVDAVRRVVAVAVRRPAAARAAAPRAAANDATIATCRPRGVGDEPSRIVPIPVVCPLPHVS